MTIQFPARRAAVLLAALVSAGCATKGDIRTLQTEMRAMAARQDSLIAEIRRQNLSTRDTLRQTSGQLFEIRGDMGSRLDRIERSLAQLQELVGQSQLTMAAVRDQLERGGSGRSSTGGGDLGVPATGGSGADAIAAYNAAVESYNSGQYNAARYGFEDFIERFAADELVPDAYFFLGEALVQIGDPEAAIDAYKQVVQLFPASDRVPGARLGIGLTHLEQGDTTEARIEFETIVGTWPDSEEAARAREELAGMGGGVRT